MNEQAARTVVTVRIAGDDYTIRADATPEYTQECAAYVDRVIGEILGQGTILHTHKAAILGALAITDQLFRARREIDTVRSETARSASKLISDIEALLQLPDLASHS